MMTSIDWFLLFSTIVSLALAYGWMRMTDRVALDRDVWKKQAEKWRGSMELLAKDHIDLSGRYFELGGQTNGLLDASKALVKLIEDAGDAQNWSAANETDRVFVWYEFDDLREAIARAEK